MRGAFVHRQWRRALAGAIAAMVVSSLAIAAGPPLSVSADGTGTGGDYVAVLPAKLMDTRYGTGGVPATAMTDGASVSVSAAGVAGVPRAGVSAVLVVVNAIAPSTDGYLKVYPSNATRPVSTNLLYNGGESVTNSAVVGVGPDGSIKLWNGGGPSHVSVTVEGYFTAIGPDSSAAPGGFVPLSTAGNRVLNTSSGLGTTTAGPMAGDTSMTVAVRNVAGIPDDAAAVLMNIQALDASGIGGLSAWPTSGTSSSLSVISYSTASDTANSSAVAVGQDGSITIRTNSTASVNLIIDVQGYFTASSSAGSGLNLLNQRLYDSRNGSDGKIPAQGTREVVVGGFADIPTYGAAGTILNVGAINTQTDGSLRLWRTGYPEPAISQVRFGATYAHANMIMMRPGDHGRITIRNLSDTPIDVVVDVQGWFTAQRAIPVEEETAFVQAAIDQGADPEKARAAVFDVDLAEAMPTSTEEEVVEVGPDTTIDPDHTPIESVPDPGDGEPTTLGGACPSTSWTYHITVRWKKRSWAGIVIFYTDFTKRWCGNRNTHRATGVLSRAVDPHVTSFGNAAGWDAKGLVSSASEDWYYSAGFWSHNVHHQKRKQKYQQCAVKYGCYYTAHQTLNMDGFADGTLRYW